ncbi:eCIS core domain-containing protein [Anthocerotibacter panamensis]|uniref:eCIS core domain-containing protein n=1 Tax=Anthocerotibacter panamensis TaxID=2857077 RepID=UPI001C4078D2|nr:DUF4157 domain-containing protein [Anthocerotibacter panamensis]
MYDLKKKNTFIPSTPAITLKSVHQAIPEHLATAAPIQQERAATPASLQARRSPEHGNWLEQVDPQAIFQGSGSPLPTTVMAKYERLLPGIGLSHVRLHQGATVDSHLQRSGLQGLTDGANIAISSRAQTGVIEHELGHVAQRQVTGFNLNEGSRGSYEQDADHISAKLVANQPIQLKALQAKCATCEQEEQPQLMANLMTGTLAPNLQAWGFTVDWRTVATWGSCITAAIAVVKAVADCAIKCGKAAGIVTIDVATSPLDLIPALGEVLVVIEAWATVAATVECSVALIALAKEVSGVLTLLAGILALLQSSERSQETKNQINQAQQKIQQLQQQSQQQQQQIQQLQKQQQHPQHP